MSDTIYDRTDHEVEIAAELRTLAVKTIERRDPSDVQAALGLAKSGLDRLLAEPRWDLSVAFRVVDRLDVSAGDAILRSTRGLLGDCRSALGGITRAVGSH